MVLVRTRFVPIKLFSSFPASLGAHGSVSVPAVVLPTDVNDQINRRRLEWHFSCPPDNPDYLVSGRNSLTIYFWGIRIFLNNITVLSDVVVRLLSLGVVVD